MLGKCLVSAVTERGFVLESLQIVLTGQLTQADLPLELSCNVHEHHIRRMPSGECCNGLGGQSPQVQHLQ